MSFQLWIVIFLMPLEVQSHAVPHWKALRYGKDKSRRLSCGSTLNIHQDILKSGNLLHKWGFVDSQSSSIVIRLKILLKMTIKWSAMPYPWQNKSQTFYYGNICSEDILILKIFEAMYLSSLIHFITDDFENQRVFT